MKNSNQTVLECKRVKFYSREDEDVFFEWLNKIKCLKNIMGESDKILLYVDKINISNEELHNLFALFRRYKVDMKQLEIFLTVDNSQLFNKYKKSYSINVYPSKVRK